MRNLTSAYQTNGDGGGDYVFSTIIGNSHLAAANGWNGEIAEVLMYSGAVDNECIEELLLEKWLGPISPPGGGGVIYLN